MPIDKSMLAMMLMQSAPMLFQTLRSATTPDDMMAPGAVPSQGATDSDLYNLATQIEQKMPVKGSPALDSAAAMLVEGLPTDEQIPNPATGMSALDWAYADLEQMPNSPARHNLARQLAQRSRASYGLKEFFNDNIRK